MCKVTRLTFSAVFVLLEVLAELGLEQIVELLSRLLLLLLELLFSVPSILRRLRIDEGLSLSGEPTRDS